MRKKIISLFILIASPSFSQSLVKEALLYDDTDKLSGIERKYVEGPIELYVAHSRTISYCIQRNTSYSGDTTIVSEAYYTLIQKEAKNKKEELKKQNRLRYLLKKKKALSMDDLLFEESRAAYFVKGFPIKSEHFNSRHEKHILQTSVVSPGQLIIQNYFMKEWPTPYQVDTVTWNQDSTLLEWRFKRVEWELYKTLYKINGKSLTCIFQDTSITQIEYLDGKNAFINRFTYNFLYYDLLYGHHLLFLEREQEVSVTSKSRDKKIIYTYDDKKRVIEDKIYKKGKFWGRSTYQYFDD